MLIKLYYLIIVGENTLMTTAGTILLVFVVLYQALHVLQFPIQFGLLIVDKVHLTPQR